MEIINYYGDLLKLIIFFNFFNYFWTDFGYRCLFGVDLSKKKINQYGEDFALSYHYEK